MSGFDRFCAVLAAGLGALLLLMGVFGLFAGIRANFSLPPVLGLFPAFVGWGVIRSVMLAWNVTRDSSDNVAPPPTPPIDPSANFGGWENNSEEDRSR